MNSELHKAYNLLKLKSGASDDEITKAFKKAALLYHPDRNQKRAEWATEMMSQVNSAYSLITSTRFEHKEEEPKREKQTTKRSDYFAEKVAREQLIKSFVQVREETKEHLYQYYQYQLYNLALREKVMNRSTFKDVVNKIKRSYHSVDSFGKNTQEKELLDHFAVFNRMILNFYKASECLNILDSYKNSTEVEAYNQYHIGDTYLQKAEIEIFYNRHNRGHFFQEECLENAMNAKLVFSQTLKGFAKSSWAVETKIKLEFCNALLHYIELFFNE